MSYIEPEKQNFVVDTLEQCETVIEKNEALVEKWDWIKQAYLFELFC